MATPKPPARHLFVTALLRVLLLALVALLMGRVVGGWAAAFALAGAVVLFAFAYHAWKLAQLYSWLSSDHSAASVPDGEGTWGEVLTELYRLLRQARVNQQALGDSLARFQQAAAALPDGVVMLDNENNIVWCNPMAEAHWRIAQDSDRMQTITYFIRYPEFIAYLAARNFNAPLTLKLNRGSIDNDMTLSLQLVAFGNDQMLLLSRDISERERLEIMRSDFVANVSHELRTPLTVLAGFLETIHKIGADKPALLQRSLDHMGAQTERMQRLVDDLLTLSRLEDAHNKLNEGVIDIQALVAAAADDAKIMANGRHTIQVSLLPAWLTGNRDEIASLVSNLLGNAVSHSPDGSNIAVSLTVNEDRQGFQELVFAVKDNGEGIAASHLPRLTERFYRVDRSRSRAVGGTGLGLAIVKHVLVRHGGRLEIDSAQGSDDHGSTFRAVFPALRVRITPPHPEAVAA